MGPQGGIGPPRIREDRHTMTTTTTEQETHAYAWRYRSDGERFSPSLTTESEAHAWLVSRAYSMGLAGTAEEVAQVANLELVEVAPRPEPPEIPWVEGEDTCESVATMRVLDDPSQGPGWLAEARVTYLDLDSVHVVVWALYRLDDEGSWALAEPPQIEVAGAQEGKGRRSSEVDITRPNVARTLAIALTEASVFLARLVEDAAR